MKYVTTKATSKHRITTECCSRPRNTRKKNEDLHLVHVTPSFVERRHGRVGLTTKHTQHILLFKFYVEPKLSIGRVVTGVTFLEFVHISATVG